MEITPNLVTFGVLGGIAAAGALDVFAAMSESEMSIFFEQAFLIHLIRKRQYTVSEPKT